MEWIVIVDDEQTNLSCAEDVLGREGLRVTALTGGEALLDFLENTAGPLPDLILLDMVMPELDGFETLRRLREQPGAAAEIPVIFLSDAETRPLEAKGLRSGATDFIRKPFAQDILLSRVQAALRTQGKLMQLRKEAMTDSMTGFLNKNSAEDRIRAICRRETGLLCMLDLDSFKLVNDLYGHDTGDKVLILFSDLLKHNMRSEDVCGRIGGDEFLVFAKNMRTESELSHFTARMNEDYMNMLREVLGEPLRFPAGISVGAVAVPAYGRDYARLFHLADQALNQAKQTGRNGCILMSGKEETGPVSPASLLTLDSVTMILEERNISSNAMWMGRDAFINIYRYMNRYLERYHGMAYRALLTVNMVPEDIEKPEREEIMAQFRTMMQQSLRNSDVMVEVSENQIFLLLPQMHEANIDAVLDRLMGKWEQSPYRDRVDISWETGKVHLTEHTGPKPRAAGAPARVAVVDADPAAAEAAAGALRAEGMLVTVLPSGGALLDYLNGELPDLVLLAAEMPELDGYETLRKLRGCPSERRSVPVILLVPAETPEAVAAALELGAEDLMAKPCVPALLALRAAHAVERLRLTPAAPRQG